MNTNNTFVACAEDTELPGIYPLKSLINIAGNHFENNLRRNNEIMLFNASIIHINDHDDVNFNFFN